MVRKTASGFVRKEITDDGRESVGRWVERETFKRRQTKTKIKRQKKAEKKLMGMIRNL